VGKGPIWCNENRLYFADPDPGIFIHEGPSAPPRSLGWRSLEGAFTEL